MKFSTYIGSLRALGLAGVLGPNISLAQQQHDSSTILPASLLVNKAIAALGGKDSLENVTSITYQAAEYVPTHFQLKSPNKRCSIFRLRTTMENYDFYISDIVVAVSGNQNVTFSYAADDRPILQRIDRNWHISGG